MSETDIRMLEQMGRDGSLNIREDQRQACLAGAEALKREKMVLSVLPVGSIPAHTPESIPGRVEDLVAELGRLGEETSRLEAISARLKSDKVYDESRIEEYRKTLEERDRQYMSWMTKCLEIGQERDRLKARVAALEAEASQEDPSFQTCMSCGGTMITESHDGLCIFCRRTKTEESAPVQIATCGECGRRNVFGECQGTGRFVAGYDKACAKGKKA
jgi:hypothetical protein